MNLCVQKLSFTLTFEKRNIFLLDLGYKSIELTFCQLLSLRKKVLDKSTPSEIINILDHENFILLFIADNKHLVYLDIPQLLELKELMVNVFNNKSETILA